MQSHEAVAHVHSPSSSLDGPATPPPSSAAAMSIPADRSRLQVEGRAPTRARYCSASSSETSAERLTDDLILEILPRVPAKSLCCFRCVSKHWLGLIDHPDHRKILPQTLAGFFYSPTSTHAVLDFCLEPPLLLASVSGSPCPVTSISFAFLPNHMRGVVLDCCNGLFLCRWNGVSTQISDFSYIVCNPATEKWTALPASGQDTGDVVISFTRLGFDPAQSSHFHVFELLEDVNSLGHTFIVGVAVYSSETGGWVHNKERWNQHMRLPYPDFETAETVFLNGHLYFQAFASSSRCVAAVDTEGETWSTVAIPRGGLHEESFMQLSQGRLHHANYYGDEDNVAVRIGVYVLENSESKDWTLKHTVETSYLFGGMDDKHGLEFEWVGMHPECSSIFFTADPDTKLMCYNMDTRQVKVICNLKDVKPRYLPYVPLYAELQSLHM